MTDVSGPLAAGCYARQQIGSRDPLVSWSHRRRFGCGLALARPFTGGRVLDYGCGDGTFLALLRTSGSPPALAVGADLDPRLVLDCQRRFGTTSGMRFVDMSTLQHAGEAESYDAVFCMEVLEHVIDPLPLLKEFDRLLRPEGTLVISVPLETGPPVLVKQIVRGLAGLRHVGHYPGTSGYTPLEMVKSVFAGSRQHIPRPVFPRDDGSGFHDHKGFNWQVLRAAVASRFELVRTVTSPFNWLGPYLSAQVWFMARRGDGRRRIAGSPAAGVRR